MSTYIDQLAGHFASQRNALPEDVRGVVDAGYWVGDWDSLTPAQRIDLAWQYDTPATDGQRLNHVHTLIKLHDQATASGPGAMSELKELNERIQTTRRHLLNDQLARAQTMPTPTEIEQSYQRAMVDRLTIAIDALDSKGFDPEAPLPRAASAATVTTQDTLLLATPNQLTSAFKSYTGMDANWFSQLKDTPALFAARKVRGQGGRGHIAEPLFCPYEVLQWLINPNRRKGRKLSPEKGWQLFESHFPRAYNAFSMGDPRTDSSG